MINNCPRTYTILCESEHGECILIKSSDYMKKMYSKQRKFYFDKGASQKVSEPKPNTYQVEFKQFLVQNANQLQWQLKIYNEQKAMNARYDSQIVAQSQQPR